VQHQLGADDVPDLLMISVSGTDYTGHAYGPDSLEYADHLRRADRALLRLYERLAQRTRVAVLVTSDHGVARMPEHVRVAAPTAARFDGKAIAVAAEAALDAHAGAGDWVLGFAEYYLYLSPAALARPDAAALRAIAIQAAASCAGVYAAFDARDPSLAAHANGDLVRQVRASLDPERGGDVLVVPAFGAIPEGPAPGRGTTHGSPWPYDTHVPVWMWGAGVSPGRNAEPLELARVASTLASLLGIAPPKAATLPPLPGVVARR
jgi:arylsulfatase A-like enzyme